VPRLPEIPTIPLDGVAHGVIRLDEAARSRSRDELAAALRERLPELARELLGRPTMRSSREWRWGRHGSLSLVMSGAKAGQWFDHEAGQGGGFVDLIARELNRGRPVVDNWTVEMVEDRLAEAAAVIRRLPPVRVPGYFNTWPPVVVEFADRVGQDPEPMRLPPPSPAAISRMEETLGWLRWLKAEHAKLVWARTEGAPWKQICWRFGISRATAHRRWRYALSLIAYRLNGRRLRARRSRRPATVLAGGL
jgi:Domain of unknown function (DUF6362)